MSTTPPPTGGSSPPPSPGPVTPGYWSHFIVALLTAIFAVGVTIAVTPGTPSPENPKPRPKVTVTLGGQGKKAITLDRPAQKIVTEQKAEDAAGDTSESESNLHESTAPAPTSIEQAAKLKPSGQPSVPVNVPQAAPSQPGCTSAFVRNQSSRNGAPIEEGFIHWTGSPITPTAAGGLAIVRWFDTPAAQASSNYITDQAGRCWYTVPETAKAWTQAAANPWSLSVEIVNPGVLPLFRTAAAKEAVVKLMIAWHHHWKIPYQHGAVNANCVPTRPGFLAHRDGGACAGGHPDVGLPSEVDDLIKTAKAQDSPRPPLNARQKRACDLLNYHRRRAHVIGKWYPSRRQRANVLAKQIPAGRCRSKYRKR